MSHRVVQKTAVKNPEIVRQSCRFLNLSDPQITPTTAAVQLKDWYVPAMFDLRSGQVNYDSDYPRNRLDEFLQRYAIESARQDALNAGYTFSEQELEGGFREFLIEVPG